MKSAIEYWNSSQEYNFIGNNCAEIATKTWNKIFDEQLNGRTLGVFRPGALRNSIEENNNSYHIDFHSEVWTAVINKEVVNW